MDHATMLNWWVLLGLGAFHGINPGMGWLFAVALGLQEQRARGVLRALWPLGVGHALAVAAALAVALLAGAMLTPHALRWPVAAVLVLFGLSRLIRHRHPRWARMRVGAGGLVLWSFLMASAHGAGLMVVPVWLSMSTVAAAPACHGAVGSVGATPPSLLTALLATGVHALGYLAVTAGIALLVFEKVGVAILRRAWLNLDMIWALALIGTGLLTLTL